MATILEKKPRTLGMEKISLKEWGKTYYSEMLWYVNCLTERVPLEIIHVKLCNSPEMHVKLTVSLV